MRTNTATASLFSVLVVLAACAGAGKDFIRPDAGSFKLGQTTYSQVIQKMGEPKTVSDVVQNEKQVKSVVYSYANANGQPLEEGVIPYRGMTYSFYNDTLVGEQFMSSFKSDNTNFDEKLVDRIQKGQTSRAEVIQLLGPPTASFIAPMVKETSGEAIGYTYQAIRGGLFSGLKVSMKALRISFDGNGVVTEVQYSSQGTK
jgi:hypothetical protein